MKKIFAIASLSASLLAVSCVKDLNTLPLNDYDLTSESAYVDEASYLKGLAYINAYYSFVSQNDAGSSDLPSFKDAGQSELLRQWTVLNDLPTGAMDISWGDSYVEPIESKTWTNAANTAITAVYTRALKGVVLVNEYLLQTSDDKLSARGHNGLKEEIAQFRAEARFHRAMFNYILLDIFGNPPYCTPENIGGRLIYRAFVPKKTVTVKVETHSETADGESTETREIESDNCTFSSGESNFAGKTFEGGKYSCSFGSYKVDLRGATVTKGAVLELHCSFGESKVTLPAGTSVSLVKDSVFGTVNCSVPNVDNADIVVKAECAFGAINIVSE